MYLSTPKTTEMDSESDSGTEKGYDEKSELIRPAGRWVRVLKSSGRIFHFARPILSLVQPAYLKKSVKSAKLRRTAYLDGIRGFAALLVYFLHHQLWSHDAQKADRKLESAWGYNGEYYFAAFHGIRTFFTGGHYAVATFFVLSGYALSTKPLALINDKQYTTLGDTLASGLFRRWLRLYLPIIFVTFAVLSTFHIFGILADFMPEPSYRAGIWKWYVDVKNFTFVFRTGGEPWLAYNAHTWSIPVEMKGSLVIYTTLLALSRCTRKARLACEAALMFYFMYIADGAHFAMFTAGMFLCDVDYISGEDGMPAFLTGWGEQARTIFFHVLLVISVFLGGVPSYDSSMDVLRDSPGWYHLSWLKPQAVFDYKWFYLFFAATILVFIAPRIPWLKRFFESQFCQYLGRICYMFYLLHGPVMWTLGDRLYAAVGWSRESHEMTIPTWSNVFPIPAIGPFGLELNYILPHLILLPLTLWLAEVGTTLIDDNSLAFTAWLYRQVTVPAEERALLKQHDENRERAAPT